MSRAVHLMWVQEKRAQHHRSGRWETIITVHVFRVWISYVIWDDWGCPLVIWRFLPSLN